MICRIHGDQISLPAGCTWRDSFVLRVYMHGVASPLDIICRGCITAAAKRRESAWDCRHRSRPPSQSQPLEVQRVFEGVRWSMRNVHAVLMRLEINYDDRNPSPESGRHRSFTLRPPSWTKIPATQPTVTRPPSRLLPSPHHVAVVDLGIGALGRWYMFTDELCRCSNMSIIVLLCWGRGRWPQPSDSPRACAVWSCITLRFD
jgi:hypothetical protein